MELSQSRTVKIVALLLLTAAISQPIYTVLYQYAPDFNRQIFWWLESLLFPVTAAFAGSALVLSKRYTLGFSAIAFSAVLNVIQVGIGLTQFGAFREAVTAVPEISAAAGGVFALSFFAYNAAKILLALAALDFGMAKMKDGNKALGGLTVLVGVVAFVLNAAATALGRGNFQFEMAAGLTGVVATLLLALCLFTVKSED